jgi:hypothetical protein
MFVHWKIRKYGVPGGRTRRSLTETRAGVFPLSSSAAKAWMESCSRGSWPPWATSRKIA